MLKTLTCLAAAAALCGAPAGAFAGEKKPAPSPGGASLLLQPFAVPVVLNGRLANFIYVTLRLSLGPHADAEKMRAQEPFFRDALVRAAYRTPLQLPADPNVMNEPVLRRVVLSESARIAGAGAVTGVQLTRQQPQRFLPKPAAAKPAAEPAPIV